MLRIIGYIAAALLVAIGGICAYATTKPDTFHVARTVTVKAPPDKIFPLINDLKQWMAWSPFEDKDPDMKRSFGAVTVGKGALYAWESNGVGTGNMVIADSTMPNTVAIKLNMIKPLTASNDVTFTLAPQSDGTAVTWAMQGEVPYIAKVVHVFFDMDRMVGGDFHAGLVKLKAVAEK